MRLPFVSTPLALIALLLFVAVSARAVYVGFEPPAYTAGGALPAPWTLTGNGAVTTQSPAAGLQSLMLGHNASGVAYARLPIYVDSAQGQALVRVCLCPDSYNPGSYQAGFVTIGGLAVYDAASSKLLGAVYFDTIKPYSETMAPQYRVLRAYTPGHGDYTYIGYWLPGVYHTLTFSIDWVQNTTEIRIDRPDTVVYKFAGVADGARIDRVDLAGTHLGYGILPAGQVYFDELAYTAPPQVATPTVNRASGVYQEAQSVELTCTTPDARIYYTTNGAVPTQSTTEYTGTPIAAGLGVTNLKARAFRTNWTPSAVIDARIEVVNYRPDALLRLSSENSYTGNGVYNTDGTSQTKAALVAPGGTRQYLFQVQNDGSTADTITITGPGSSGGWTVRYYETGSGTELTAAITGAGWTPRIVPNGYRGCYARVTAGAGVAPGAAYTLLLTATSGGQTSRVDVVKAVTTLQKRQPDLSLRTLADTGYTGEDVYNTTAAGQTRAQSCAAGATVQYYLHIQNDGNVTDGVKIIGTAGDAAWTVQYLNDAGADITAQVTGSGWTIPTLSKGGMKFFRVLVTPGAGVAAGTSKTIGLYASSTGDATRRDVVKATTSVQPTQLVYQPDLQLRTATEATYTGDNLYNADGTGQAKTHAGVPGTAVTCLFRAQNDGNVADILKITGPAAGSGWTVRYYTMSTNVEITDQVTGAGYLTPSLAPGGVQGLYAKITAAQDDGSMQEILLTAVSTHDAAKGDAVKVTTTFTTEVIFNNWNIGAVSNGPSNSTAFTIAAPRTITYVDTYHYFNGGVLPGTISLRHADGTVYGPWQTTGLVGQGGVPNAVWICYPNVTIKAGTYTVVDSHLATWSHNSGSNYCGFSQVRATVP